LVKLSGLEKEVLLYLKAALDRNVLDGVTAKEIAENIDEKLDAVIGACEKLDAINYGNIKKREVKKDRILGSTIEITNEGIVYLQTQGLVNKD
jgi:hypothetical protein